MKCKYSFPVRSKIRLSRPVRVPFQSTTVELSLSDTGMVNLLTVTVDAPDPRTWPSIGPSQEPGIAWSIDYRPAASDELIASMHTLEGLLALYGLESIEFHAMSIEWLPETADESARLPMTSLIIKPRPVPDGENEIIPADLVERAIVAAPKALGLEMPLGFYRIGSNYLHEGRYIAAFYQFYLLLETLFANGRHRKAAVKKEFMNAQTLTRAIAKALRPEEARNYRPARRRLLFQRHYLPRSVADAVDHWVELRGFLHHHSLARPGIWHPSGDNHYEIDACVICRVACEVACGLAVPFMVGEPESESGGL